MAVRIAPQARVWITEFASDMQIAPAPFAQLPAHAKHPPLDLSDGLEHTTQLDPLTRYIRIISEVQCAFSTTGPATTNDILLPRLVPEYFGVAGEKTVSVIAAPSSNNPA
jgi:hypothetical protein